GGSDAGVLANSCEGFRCAARRGEGEISDCRGSKGLRRGNRPARVWASPDGSQEQGCAKRAHNPQASGAAGCKFNGLIRKKEGCLCRKKIFTLSRMKADGPRGKKAQNE